MVEILVVMLIATILMGISIYGVRSARTSGRHLATVAVANNYATAAEKFARDHEGRFPNSPGAANADGSIDWDPADLEHGPKSDILGQRRFYLGSVPEGIQTKRVTIGGSGATRFDYASSGSGTGFVITVRVEGSAPCTIVGGDQAEVGKACSKR